MIVNDRKWALIDIWKNRLCHMSCGSSRAPGAGTEHSRWDLGAARSPGSLLSPGSAPPWHLPAPLWVYFSMHSADCALRHGQSHRIAGIDTWADQLFPRSQIQFMRRKYLDWTSLEPHLLHTDQTGSHFSGRAEQHKSLLEKIRWTHPTATLELPIASHFPVLVGT